MDSTAQEYEWYLAREGQRYGPIADDDLHQLVAKGQLKPEDLIWRKGFPEWVEARTVAGLLPEEENIRPEPVSSSEIQENHYSGIDHSPNDTYNNQSFQSDTELKVEPVFDRPGSGDEMVVANQQVYGQEEQLPRRRKSFARRFFSFMLFMLIIGGIAVFALPPIIPADFIREHIARIVKEQTGRTLTVRGKSSFSLVPNIGMRMHDVSISNPPGMPGEPVIQMKSFEVQLKFLPLLERKIEVQRFILTKPKVSLKVDGQGQSNWNFAQAASNNRQTALLPTKQDHAPVEAGLLTALKEVIAGPELLKAQAASDSSYPLLQDIKLREIKVKDGTVAYYDEKSGFSDKFENIDGTVSLPSKTTSMNITGTGQWRAEEVSYLLSLASPFSMIEGEKVPYNLTVKSKYFSTLLRGEMSWAGGIYLTGVSELQVRSLRRLAKWLSHEIAPGSGMEAFSVIGDFTAQSQRINITNASITLDDTTANGQATIVLSGKRPYVSATLASDTVYLSPYFRDEPISKSSLHGSRFRFAGQTGSTGQFTQINQDQDDNTPVQEIEREPVSSEDSEISAKPINNFASSLQVFDADITFNAKKILYEELLIDNSQIVMEVRKGKLDAKISEMNLYSGKVGGTFLISSDGPLPRFSADLKISDVVSLDFLKSLYGFSWISGKADMEIKLSSSGHSRKQILSELVGNSKVTLLKGAVEGIDITGRVQDLQKVASQSLVPNSTQRTEFDELKATFKFNRGIASNKDLLLSADNLKLKGQGVIDFSRGLIDYQVDTKINGKDSAQAKKMSVPIRIKGSIDAPRIKLDVNETIAKNKDAIVQGLNNTAIKDPEEQTGAIPDKPKNFEDMIKGVLGKSGN